MTPASNKDAIELSTKSALSIADLLFHVLLDNIYLKPFKN
jgi:hypothetical protein